MSKNLPRHLSIALLGLSSCSQQIIKTDVPLQNYSNAEINFANSDRKLKIDLTLLEEDINRYRRLRWLYHILYAALYLENCDYVCDK